MPPSDPADAAEERLSRHRPASALYEFATFRDKTSPLGVFSTVRADSPAVHAYAYLDKQVTVTILVV